jgi:hypothetical protein
MSSVGAKGRSYKPIRRSDLELLAGLASADRQQFFKRRKDWARFYRGRVLAVALCQGAASHFVDHKTGINDFDIYTFYAEHPKRRWYAKRMKHVDFGEPRFGQSIDRPTMVGRRVDLMGRTLPVTPKSDPGLAICRWLQRQETKTARLLAQKAVVLIRPRARCGEVLWVGPRVRLGK